MPLYPQTVNYCLASRINQALAQPTSYRPWPEFGIPAEMTTFLAWLNLCITMSAGAWERSNSHSTETTMEQAISFREDLEAVETLSIDE